MYWVLPMAMAVVGMMPVSLGALWMVLTTCLERPFDHIAEPEYLSLTTPSATWIPLDRSRSLLRNRTLYRHCWPLTAQYPKVSPNAIRTWWLPGSPLSQRIPRSVPEIPKRLRVLLGPFGP